MTAKKSAQVAEPVVETPPAATPLDKLAKIMGEATQEYVEAIPDGEGMKAFKELIEFYEASLIVLKGFYDTATKLAAMS